jgi:hypothetical protein
MKSVRMLWEVVNNTQVVESHRLLTARLKCSHKVEMPNHICPWGDNNSYGAEWSLIFTPLTISTVYRFCVEQAKLFSAYGQCKQSEVLNVLLPCVAYHPWSADPSVELNKDWEQKWLLLGLMESFMLDRDRMWLKTVTHQNSPQLKITVNYPPIQSGNASWVHEGWKLGCSQPHCSCSL